MQIWVDADACPREIKHMLFRAASRTKTTITLVANQPLAVPKTPFVQVRTVRPTMDAADREIVSLVEDGDLVVTADIPLAAAVVSRGGHALDPRGELYTDDNVADRLAVRDVMDGLRGSGEVTGGPAGFSPKHKQAFANQLDRWLAR